MNDSLFLMAAESMREEQIINLNPSSQEETMHQSVAKEVMTVAQISKPGRDFEVVEREIPQSRHGTSENQDTSVWCLPQ